MIPPAASTADILLGTYEVLLRTLTGYPSRSLLAKSKLRAQLDQISLLRDSPNVSERFWEWREGTLSALTEYFGEGSPFVKQFQVATVRPRRSTKKWYVEMLNGLESVLQLAVMSADAASPSHVSLTRTNVFLSAIKDAPAAVLKRIAQLSGWLLRPLGGRKRQAKYLLTLRVAELDSSDFQSRSDSMYVHWRARCLSTLAHFFGMDSVPVRSFGHTMETAADMHEAAFEDVLTQARAVLLASFDDVDELGIRQGFLDSALVRATIAAVGPVAGAAAAILAATG
jgi:hypothetical protein